MKRYSEIIMRIREAGQLERKQFASKVGVCYHTVYLWEIGRKFPSRKNMQTLIKYGVRHGLEIDSTDFLDV